jgi:hypothetical protein
MPLVLLQQNCNTENISFIWYDNIITVVFYGGGGGGYEASFYSTGLKGKSSFFFL